MADQDLFRRGLVDIANARIEDGFTGEGGELQQIIEAHDIIFAVWQDANERDGVGMTLVKGDALLHTIVDTQRAAPTNMTAVPCSSLEEAEAMRRVYGDPKHQH